ncbi:MAG: LuxR C-terminal-related transcriptional regulator [Tepidiformaceae bacterium]
MVNPDPGGRAYTHESRPLGRWLVARKRRKKVPARLLPVLRELKGGTHNQAIADTCGIQVHTVEKYISDLLAIFECDGRGELIARAAAGEFDDYL